MPFKCPLCKSQLTNHVFYQEQYKRDFYNCESCFLCFVNRNQLLTIETEKERYDLHQNDIRSAGYEKFLRRLINPILDKISNDSNGLDFGCGPYPMLIEIFKEEGFKNIKGWDPIYHNDESVFSDKYDFITMCEVFEHVYDVKFEMDRIVGLLRSGGLLVISTGIKISDNALKTWHYLQDDTHINLVTDQTINWIALNYNLEIVDKAKDLIIFSKI
ncbi:MAG: hypothetical protein ACJAS4_000892 [Bacteriovoracaceae bacterium]|jgi:hypothetical protein